MREYRLFESDRNIEKDGDSVLVKFCTDAQEFIINYAVSSIVKCNFPHVGVSVKEGLSVLFREDDCKIWKPIDLISRDRGINVKMSHRIKKNKSYEVVIYGPILAHLEKLSIIISEESFLKFSYEKKQKTILFLGGGKTYGIGTTSAAMMFRNIIRRNYDISAKCISYNENNFLKKVYEKVKELNNLEVYDMVFLEVDEYGQELAVIRQYLEAIIQHIVSAKKVILWHAMDERFWDKKEEVYKLIDQYENDNFLHLNMNYLFDKEHVDMCTYSMKFINDAANILIYQHLNKELEGCLWNI